MKYDEVEITTPCTERWDAMRRDGHAQRFCAVCEKHVVDLSAMTRGEAEAWLARDAPGASCVTYLHDASGELLFRPEPPPPSAPPAQLRGLSRLLAAAALVAPLLAGCDSGPGARASDEAAPGVQAAAAAPEAAAPGAGALAQPANAPSPPPGDSTAPSEAPTPQDAPPVEAAQGDDPSAVTGPGEAGMDVKGCGCPEGCAAPARDGEAAAIVDAPEAATPDAPEAAASPTNETRPAVERPPIRRMGRRAIRPRPEGERLTF